MSYNQEAVLDVKELRDIVGGGKCTVAEFNKAVAQGAIGAGIAGALTGVFDLGIIGAGGLGTGAAYGLTCWW